MQLTDLYAVYALLAANLCARKVLNAGRQIIRHGPSNERYPSVSRASERVRTPLSRLAGIMGKCKFEGAIHDSCTQHTRMHGLIYDPIV